MHFTFAFCLYKYNVKLGTLSVGRGLKDPFYEASLYPLLLYAFVSFRNMCSNLEVPFLRLTD